MLIFVALLLAALMGVAALSVDLGLASLSQAAMQVAADDAAREGLRLRDDVPGDPAASDAERRAAASLLVQRLEDDDLLATPGDAVGLGAGAELILQPGASPVPGASALLTVGGDGFWRPVLQENLDNLVHGDLVAGTYSAAAAHEEPADYVRADFAVPDSADAPSAPAFLARLRRTNDVLGLDAQDGTSSTGPTLPLLFGQGNFVHGAGGGAYDPRTDGFTVRATAIADVRAAIAVGPADNGAGMGAVPWSLQRGFWDSLAPEVPVTLTLDAGSGQLALAGTGVVGTACELVLGAGQPVLAAPAGSLPVQGWIAVTSDEVDGVSRAVAFGWMDLLAEGPTSVSLVKHAAAVAPLNASAVATALLPELPADMLQQLLSVIDSLSLAPESGLVLAPVLVR